MQIKTVQKQKFEIVQKKKETKKVSKKKIKLCVSFTYKLMRLMLNVTKKLINPHLYFLFFYYVKARLYYRQDTRLFAM